MTPHCCTVTSPGVVLCLCLVVHQVTSAGVHTTCKIAEFVYTLHNKSSVCVCVVCVCVCSVCVCGVCVCMRVCVYVCVCGVCLCACVCVRV